MDLIKTADVTRVAALPDVVGDENELDEGWDAIDKE